MKKVMFLGILISISSFITKGQIDTVYPDVIFRANIEGVQYKIMQDPEASKKKRLLLKDSIKIDSFDFGFPYVYQDVKHNRVYIPGFYEWNFKKNTFEKLDSFNYRVYGPLTFYNNNFYLLLKNENNKVYKIHEYNPRTRGLSVFLDLTDELKGRKDKKDLGYFYFIKGKKNVLLTIGYCASDGISSEEKYMYSFESNEFYKSNGTELLNKNKANLVTLWPLKDIYVDGKHYGGSTADNGYDDIVMLDSNLIAKGRILTKSNHIRGYNIQNNKVVSVNFESQLDSYEAVIITVKLTSRLDLLFYKIFKSQKISPDALSGFGMYELNLLKNMVFAKHNYAFDTPYYQAFFNLFRVYRATMDRDSRTKSVNHLLTETDLYNLNLIKKEISGRALGE